MTATIPVGNYPHAVAVNPDADTIYVTNSGSNTVSAINGRTNTVAATVSVGTQPQGIAADRRITQLTYQMSTMAR